MSIVESARETVRSPAFKFIIVLVLILLLTIPLLFVYGLVYERERYANQAETDISRMWADEQTLSGPYVIVPMETERQYQHGNEQLTRTERKLLAFLPEELQVSGDLQSEVRKRGIFSVPVYRSGLKVAGRFTAPDVARVSTSSDRLLWDQAELVVMISDVRGIKNTSGITVGGTARKFRAGTGTSGGDVPGIHVPLGDAEAKSGFAFSFELTLNGSRGLQFGTAGGDTKVALKSDWPHPSFSGQFLPDTREVSETGFTAAWQIPRLARGQGQERQLSSVAQLRDVPTLGATLYQPVRFYSLAQRALKYALGFIAIAFFAVFVMEVQSRKRMHWIQYIFVGIALVIFYVLLIGTAEHVGFDLGYLGAAAATSVLIAAYVGTVSSSVSRGIIIGGVLLTIYALLYLLLRLEDYALLVGSIAAFVLVAIVMFATRKVDWARGGELLRNETVAPADNVR